MSPTVVLAYNQNNIKPGWVALLVVVLLALATFLLWRSMNTQLGKIKVRSRAEQSGTAATERSEPVADEEAAPGSEQENGDGDDPGHPPPPR